MAPVPRVLCLHGRHQTGGIFQDRLARLRRSDVRLEMVFVDGPSEAVTEDGDRLLGWRPEGSASWAATEEALRTAWSELGPFDGVLGFSEGTQAAEIFCRLHATSSGGPQMFGLRFAIFAGGLPADGLGGGGEPLNIPSLHFFSKADPVVEPAACKKLAASFRGAKLVEHHDGHVFPQKREQLDALAAFLEALPAPEPSLEAPAGSLPCEEDQENEVLCLEAMLCEEGELERLSEGWPVRLRARFAEDAFLDFLLPPAYPCSSRCVVSLHSRRPELEARWADLMDCLEQAHEPLGSPSVLSLLTAAREWAEAVAAGALPAGPTGGDDADKDEAQDDGWWRREEIDEALLEAAEQAAVRAPSSASVRIAGSAGYGRSWQYVVGLVGKPSAGKSTFFNAVCQLGSDAAAAMAAHPFTTIEPNISPGWFAAPCPAVARGLPVEPAPEHGRMPDGRHRMPLLVKDVAGLVPGAYRGQGRGNAFLNDLVDADALVHVVDASGRTDRQGVDQGEGGRRDGDPLGDIGWVRREIHLWVFTNVRGKWSSVRRRAHAANHEAREAVVDRLAALFSGYRIPRAMVLEGLAAAGLPPYDLVDRARGVLTWEEGDLHRLVAVLLKARFPMVVALNKADHPDAPAHIARVQAAMEGQGSPCVPCSARSELQLLEWRRAGHVEYEEASATVTAAAGAPAAVARDLKDLEASVLRALGSTGVMAAISAAVALRSPTYVFPVADFASLKGVCPEGQRGGVLCTAVMLRPQSTVDEAFSALRAANVLSGELVRAEALKTYSPTPQHRVAKREDRLPVGTEIMRIVTSKKAAWQKHTG